MKIVDGKFQLTKEEVVALHNYEKGVVTDLCEQVFLAMLGYLSDSLDEARERAIAKMIDDIKESVKKED